MPRLLHTALSFSLITALVAKYSALEHLYAAAGGSSWNSRSGWMGGGNVCKWHGIECTSGEVTTVDLGGNGVKGTLPSQLAQLTALSILNIDESHLSGTLPTGLGALSGLTTIMFGSNRRLSGTLPQLGSTALQVIDLSGTRLSGSLPTALCPKLQRIHCDHSSISGTVPTQLGHLSSLQALWLMETHISGSLPTQISRLGMLSLGFSLAKTRLSGTLPSEIGQLRRLQHLWLDHTNLSGSVPASLGAMRLRGLELHANRLSGSLPNQISNLSGSLHTCVLAAAQGPLQPKHSQRPEDRPEPDTNHFTCPLPPGLPTPCVPMLQCVSKGKQKVG